MRDAPSAYILAGGRSRRFGSNKARALLDGTPLILHVAQALEPIVQDVTVISTMNGAYGDLRLRTIADRRPDQGPLAGLERALLDREEPSWVLLVACDWVGLRASWLDTLWRARKPDHDAVAFRGNHWEPLFALYHTNILPQVQHSLTAGRRAMQTLLDEAISVALPLPNDWLKARQVNTPGDLVSGRV